MGADVVFRDDRADLIDGDLAFEGMLSAFYEDEATFAGVYGAYRHQTYDDGDLLQVVALDAYAKHDVALDARGTKLSIAAEGAALLGSTDVARLERARDGLSIRGFAAVARGTVDVPFLRLIPSLEIGFASGDGDPQNDRNDAFATDPDYTVGMILFREVLGRMSARGAERVADPSLSSRPVKGYDLTATNGAVTNAVYLFPKVRWRPIEDLELRAAFLWARAVAAVSSPFDTAQNGGSPASYRGAKDARDLGFEVDFAVAYRIPLKDSLALRFGAQAGVLKPGAAFDDAAGNGMDPIWKVRVLADVVW